MQHNLLLFVSLLLLQGCQNSKLKEACKYTISAQKQMIEEYTLTIDSLSQKLKNFKDVEQTLRVKEALLLMARENSMKSSRYYDSLKKIVKQAKRKEDAYKKQIKDLSFYDDFIKDDTLSNQVKIAIPGVFYKNDVVDSLLNLEWFGIYKADDNYHIKKTGLTIEPTSWRCSDAGNKDARKIAATSNQYPLLLISGLQNIVEGAIESVGIKNSRLFVGQQNYIKFNEVSINLSAFGTILHNTTIEEYFLKIQAKKQISADTPNQNLNQTRSKYISQTFAGVRNPCLNSAYNIFWAGDIDQDGLLDLILEIDCMDAGGYYMELFLSSNADENTLLKKAAIWKNIICRGC